MRLFLILLLYSSNHLLGSGIESWEKGKQALNTGFYNKSLTYLSEVDYTQLSSKVEREEFRENIAEISVHLSLNLSEELSRLPLNQPSSEHEAKLIYWQALEDMKQGKFALALDRFTTLSSAEHPYHHSILYNTALLQMELGNIEESIRHLSATPLDLISHRVLLAECYLRQGNLESAEGVLDELPTSMAQNKSDVLRSVIAYEKEQPSEAIQILEQNNYSLSTYQGRTALALLAQYHLEVSSPKAENIIESVILNALPTDPLLYYFDQYLLSATQQSKNKSELPLLEKVNNSEKEWLKPYSKMAEAQLSKSDSERLSTLKEIYTTSPKNIFHEKALLAASKIMISSLEKDDAIRALNSLLEYLSPSPLKAKILAEIATLSTGTQKVTTLETALESASPSQELSIRKNLELARFASGTEDDGISLDNNPDLLLEKALFIKAQNPVKAITLLELYLTQSTDKERHGEAHLELAKLLLSSPQKGLTTGSKAHLDTIKNVFYESIINKEEYHLTRLKYLLTTEATEEIERLIKEVTLSTTNLLISGNLLYRNDYYYLASLQFRKVYDSTDSARQKALANFYLGLSHLHLDTKEYLEDAISRFSSIRTEKTSPFYNSAGKLLASHYLKTGDVEQCLSLINTLTVDTETLIIKAKALSMKSDPESVVNAVSILKTVMVADDQPTLRRYQLAYEMGLILSANQMLAEALDLYYSVATFESLPTPTSIAGWDLYKRMGSKGVKLLKETRKWRTAFQFAQILAKSDSPHAEFFKTEAKSISLEHVLWDED